MQRANRLKEWRRALGVSGQGLAVMAGCSLTTIVGIERYQHLPGEDVRRRICEALAVSEHLIWPPEESNGCTTS